MKTYGQAIALVSKALAAQAVGRYMAGSNNIWQNSGIFEAAQTLQIIYSKTTVFDRLQREVMQDYELLLKEVQSKA